MLDLSSFVISFSKSLKWFNFQEHSVQKGWNKSHVTCLPEFLVVGPGKSVLHQKHKVMLCLELYSFCWYTNRIPKDVILNNINLSDIIQNDISTNDRIQNAT